MTLLQGHLDMVCEKNEGTVHDFAADPIKVVRDGDWLKRMVRPWAPITESAEPPHWP